MRDGDPKLTRVAKKIAMSPRSLQRQLKEHGVDFKQLMDDTRRRFALNYLRDRRNTLTDVAFLLGYSELSAFNRAFRRWTGSAPLDCRRRLAHNRKRKPGHERFCRLLVILVVQSES
jgi:AraC-like DNA-binding protein